MGTKESKKEESNFSKFTKFTKFTISKNWGRGLTNIRGGMPPDSSLAFTQCSAPYCKQKS
jgi:hypothetical protein